LVVASAKGDRFQLGKAGDRYSFLPILRVGIQADGGPQLQPEELGFQSLLADSVFVVVKWLTVRVPGGNHEDFRSKS